MFDNFVIDMQEIINILFDIKQHYMCAAIKQCKICTYRKISNISRTLVGNKIVDHSDVVRASRVGAALTKSSLST